MLGLETPPPFHSDPTGRPHPLFEVFFENPGGASLWEDEQTKLFSFSRPACIAVEPIIGRALGSDFSTWTALDVPFEHPVSTHTVIPRTDEWCIFQAPVKLGISAAAVRSLIVGDAQYLLSEPCAPRGLGQSIGPAGDLVTPEARQFATAHRLLGSTNLARRFIQDLLPPATIVRIGVYHDPEIVGYETLSFNVSIDASAERLMELNERVQDQIFEKISPQHRRYFSFHYGLE